MNRVIAIYLLPPPGHDDRSVCLMHRGAKVVDVMVGAVPRAIALPGAAGPPADMAVALLAEADTDEPLEERAFYGVRVGRLVPPAHRRVGTVTTPTGPILIYEAERAVLLG